jgi:hypothetical protein
VRGRYNKLDKRNTTNVDRKYVVTSSQSKRHEKREWEKKKRKKTLAFQERAPGHTMTYHAAGRGQDSGQVRLHSSWKWQLQAPRSITRGAG